MNGGQPRGAAVLVVPSLKVSGGIREALRLAADLRRGGLATTVLSMWKSPHPMESEAPVAMLSDWPPRIKRAPFELPSLVRRFARWKRNEAPMGGAAFIFTHYATLPLAWFAPKPQRYFYVQDLEWNFLGNGMAAAVLRHVVLGFYRTGRLISANAYLTEQLRALGMDVALEAPIWADPGFAAELSGLRDVDLVMVLRKGAHKRLDLYLRFIELARERGLRTAAITPEDEIAAQVRGKVDELLLRPSREDMISAYGRSKCFIHLSEHEGFGLPPLEAMGSGCVPICRDSGGVRAFMRSPGLRDNLLGLDVPVDAVFDHAASLIGDAQALQALSVAARLRFDEGLREVADSRRHLAAALAGQSAS